MICCDLCKQPPAGKGSGKNMFYVLWASSHSSNQEEFSVFFAHESTMATRLYRLPGAKAICGRCLDKLGIPEHLAKAAEEDRIRNRQASVAAPQLGEGKRQLAKGQEQLQEAQRLIEFNPGG